MKWDNTNQVWLTNTYSTTCGWANGTMTLNPGEGAFLCACCSEGFYLTFTGTPHVPVLPVTLLPGQWYLLSRRTNDIGTYTNITGLAPDDGTTAYMYSDTHCIYNESDTFVLGIGWIPSDPTTDHGQRDVDCNSRSVSGPATAPGYSLPD